MAIPVGSGGGGWGTGLPTPERYTRKGIPGLFDAWGHLVKAISSTVPYLAQRLSYDVSTRRAG
jgi:hypothetical protein